VKPLDFDQEEEEANEPQKRRIGEKDRKREKKAKANKQEERRNPKDDDNKARRTRREETTEKSPSKDRRKKKQSQRRRMNYIPSFHSSSSSSDNNVIVPKKEEKEKKSSRAFRRSRGESNEKRISGTAGEGMGARVVRSHFYSHISSETSSSASSSANAKRFDCADSSDDEPNSSFGSEESGEKEASPVFSRSPLANGRANGMNAIARSDEKRKVVERIASISNDQPFELHSIREEEMLLLGGQDILESTADARSSDLLTSDYDIASPMRLKKTKFEHLPIIDKLASPVLVCSLSSPPSLNSESESQIRDGCDFTVPSISSFALPLLPFLVRSDTEMQLSMISEGISLALL
jgi:hypothetical protein